MRLLAIMALQLRLSGEWILAGSASDIDGAIALADAARPDVILLDLWLHGEHSLDLLRQLRASLPQPLVVVLSAEADPAWGERAIAAGATAYLSKLEVVDLPAALRTF